jgi:hypothetical protein
LERSAFSAHALLGEAAGFFLTLEELLSLLVSVLAHGEDVVGVSLFTASHSFEDIDLLLDEDTVSLRKSVKTLLLNLLGLLRRILRRILRRVLLWGILLGRVSTLLRGISLRRVLLRRVLLRRVLLRRITALLLRMRLH